ncbi:MAG: pseudouridine synthase [Planctomycetaceae bacterium]|nr:pseudouridine synthase [Planctomycetaceae bacterium]
MNSPPSIELLYQDEHLLAVAKPSGLFVHRSEKDRSQRVAALQLARDLAGQDVYTIHRLDRATSGVLLFGMTSAAATAMSGQFARREVTKHYLALVRGHCPETGVMDTPLVSARGRGLPSEHPFAEPQEAITRFTRRSAFAIPIAGQPFPTTRCSLVDVWPGTGRFHQIRRHFNYASHPVIGDSSHGDSRQNRLFRERLGVSRLMLAAIGLAFSHPVTEKKIQIHCSPAADFLAVTQRLLEFSV